MNRLTGRKYQALLLVLLLMLVVYPVVRADTESRLLFDYLFTGVFAASLFVVFDDRRHRMFALILGVPTLVGIWTGYFLPGLPRIELAVAFHLLTTAFFAFTIAVILHNIRRDHGVTMDSIYGALCGYLLAGLAFGHLYCMIEWLSPCSFSGAAVDHATHENRHIIFTYFSFLTLTTVGYGDILPLSPAARGMAMIEAVTGQFYMAVLVATLIGKRISQDSHQPHQSS